MHITHGSVPTQVTGEAGSSPEEKVLEERLETLRGALSIVEKNYRGLLNDNREFALDTVRVEQYMDPSNPDYTVATAIRLAQMFTSYILQDVPTAQYIQPEYEISAKMPPAEIDAYLNNLEVMAYTIAESTERLSAPRNMVFESLDKDVRRLSKDDDAKARMLSNLRDKVVGPNSFSLYLPYNIRELREAIDGVHDALPPSEEANEAISTIT